MKGECKLKIYNKLALLFIAPSFICGGVNFDRDKRCELEYSKIYDAIALKKLTTDV